MWRSRIGASTNALCLVVLFLVLCAPPSRAQVLPFVHYTPEGDRVPLPSAEVHEVYQDDLGFIWMAVYSSGLVRYDGHRIETYTRDDGLKDLGIWDVVEDSAGRMWVASNAGLVVSEKPIQEYAGTERIHFVDSLDGVPLIGTLVGKNMSAVDTKGRIWVGTASSGIVRYDVGEELSVREIRLDAEDGVSPAIRSIVARRDGSVWAGTRTGQLLVFDGVGAEGVGDEDDGDEEVGHEGDDDIERGDGEVDNGKDEYIEVDDIEDAYVVLDESDGVPANDIRTLYESPDGVLYLGTGDGRVYEVTGRSGGPSFRLLTRAAQGSIFGITASADGLLWVATQGSGAIAIDPNGTAQVYSRSNGLLADHVFGVTEDREGNLWFAQLGGVSKLRFDYRAFSGYTASSVAGELPILPSPAVGAVEIANHAGSPCPVWAATQNGVACIRQDGTSRIIGQEDGLENEWVNGLVFDSIGRLWIGTLNGIYCLSEAGTPRPPGGTRVGRPTIDGRAMTLSAFGGPAMLSLARATAPSDTNGKPTEILWFVGNRELYALVHSEWMVFKQAAGLPATVLHAAEIDSDGYVWIGTRDRGLFRSRAPVSPEALQGYQRADRISDGGGVAREIIEPIFTQVWSMADGAPSNEIYELLATTDGLWIGSPEGLILLDRASLTIMAHVTQADGLKAANVMSLAPSPHDGSLWAGTNGGLAEVDSATRTVVRTVTKQDGLLDNEVWFLGSLRVGNDGTVYYGTAHGLAIYRPSLHIENEVPPVLRIREATLTNATNGRNELVVEYAGLSFVDEKRVTFKTRLAGYESDWSEEKSEFKTRYTNLPAFFTPKEYRFEVMASNDDGLWTAEPVSYVFSVRPPWWFQWWFILGGMILLAGVLAAVVRTQRARLIRKERDVAAAREAELQLETAIAKSEAAEAEANALMAQNERQVIELQKARELEQAYKELQTMQEQLIQAEKLASLGEFTAGIAHEIKNPLNFINNFAEVTVELVDDLAERLSHISSHADFPHWDEINELLEDLKTNTTRINEHGERADGIVRSMLFHSGGYSGKREPTDVNRLTDEILDLAVHSINGSNSNVVIERDYDADAGSVRVVPQELGRVLMNLVNNAVYAAGEHRQNAGTPPRVCVSTERANGNVRIVVRDNGAGIPADVRDKIFEPFFTTKPTGTGTGLGLSLCYSIITKSYGGSITVESRPGEGAAFSVTLPLSKVPALEENGRSEENGGA